MRNLDDNPDNFTKEKLKRVSPLIFFHTVDGLELEFHNWSECQSKGSQNVIMSTTSNFPVPANVTSDARGSSVTVDTFPCVCAFCRSSQAPPLVLYITGSRDLRGRDRLVLSTVLHASGCTDAPRPSEGAQP